MEETLLELEDELRRHRQFIRTMYKWVKDDWRMRSWCMAKEIEKFLRIIEP